MRQVSKKKAERNRKKQEAYRKFDENCDGICSGCGEMKPSSHSHIVPVSEAPELESEVENIRWHCMECHKKHESHNIEVMRTMLDFEENMEYIRKVRLLYYNRLLSK
jgi:5-methylcytosine-specific restriction endonuclease McrA